MSVPSNHHKGGTFRKDIFEISYIAIGFLNSLKAEQDFIIDIGFSISKYNGIWFSIKAIARTSSIGCEEGDCSCLKEG